jgi:hypothetical protein
MWSLADVLDRIARHVPLALLPPPERARVRAVAQRLPAALTDCLYLESWLQGADSRTDLIVRLDGRGRALLADPAPRALEGALRSHPVWQRVASFVRAWTSAAGGLEGPVESVWLEFDLPGTVETPVVPVPRLFVDFAPAAQADARGARSALAVLRLLLGPDAGARAADALRAGLAVLRAGASVPYLGFDLEDDSSGVRVCVRRLGDGLVPSLRAVGWPGDAADLDRRVLQPLARARGEGAASVSVLHLDVGGAVSGRIGLEYAFARASQWRGHLRETAFLDHVVARGWCRSAARDALLAWPGRTVELMPHETWHSHLVRRLSHLKLTYATGQPIGLKAYLCARFELLGAGTLLRGRPWLPSHLGPRVDPRQPGATE